MNRKPAAGDLIFLSAYLESPSYHQINFFVEAAFSREINCHGWKPFPHSIPLVFSG
jgi:hypothetical protein